MSVIIATKGRPDDLRETLASVSRLDPPPHELLVVDGDPEPLGRAGRRGGAVGDVPAHASRADAPAQSRRARRAAATWSCSWTTTSTSTPDLLARLAAAYADPGVVGATGPRDRGRPAPVRQQALARAAAAVPRSGRHVHVVRLPAPPPGRGQRARRGADAGLPDERAARRAPRRSASTSGCPATGWPRTRTSPTGCRGPAVCVTCPTRSCGTRTPGMTSSAVRALQPRRGGQPRLPVPQELRPHSRRRGRASARWWRCCWPTAWSTASGTACAGCSRASVQAWRAR